MPPACAAAGTAKGGDLAATPFTCQLQALAALCLSYRATTLPERADSGLVPTALMATTTKR